MFTVISRVFTNQSKHILFITSVSGRSLQLYIGIQKFVKLLQAQVRSVNFTSFPIWFLAGFLRLAQTVLCVASGYRLADTAKRTSQDLKECDSLVFTRKKGFVLSHSSREILKHGSAWTTMVRLGGPVGGLIWHNNSSSSVRTIQLWCCIVPSCGCAPPPSSLPP